MNKAILMGRLTRDPEIRYSQGDNAMAIGRYTLAVDRRGQDRGTDFIPCLAFKEKAEFAEKYFRQGMRVAVTGRIQTGSYTNKEGRKIYTTEIVVEDQEFAESKRQQESQEAAGPVDNDGFMNIPDGIEDGLPFS